MEQFSLDKWLENPSRKVVTRDGRPVRIVCWDAPTKNPIYGFVEGDDGITSWRKDGRFSNLIDNIDLFFADNELTEFEKEVKDLMNSCCNEIEEADITNELAKEAASNLLDLARKELQAEFDKEMDKMLAETDKVVYQKGQQDALKDLPKWEHNIMFPKGFSDIAVQGFVDCVYSDGYLRHGKYQIKMSDLEKLPKEE